MMVHKNMTESKMNNTTPTTAEIRDNFIGQMETSFGPTLPKSFTYVLATVLAGVFILLYKYCGFMGLQMFVRTATFSETVINGRAVSPLREWGRLTGAGDPFPATQAELSVRVTREGAGGILPANSQLVHAATGVVYLTLIAYEIATATVDIVVRAVSDPSGNGGAGTIGNLNAGATLTFASPLTGVSSGAVVLAQTVTGTPDEAEDDYRERIESRFQQRPQGGAYVDYKVWAEDTPGIAQAFPYAGAAPGTVDIYVESETEADGIPTTAQQNAALNAINFDGDGQATRRPINALVSVKPITRAAFDVRVLGLSVDNPIAVRVDIEAQLRAYFLEREPFLVGLTIPPRYDRVTASAIAGVVDDVVSAAGGVFSSVVVSKGGVNLTEYTLGIGERAKLAGVAYI